jgi:hypothetical protein
MPQFAPPQRNGVQAVELTGNISWKRRLSGSESYVSQHECGGNRAATAAANAPVRDQTLV